MSIECLNRALKIQFENQTPTKRLILILLANYCDDQNSCYPSYQHIAKLSGLKDTKHIASIIKEFEELGFLRIEKRFKADGGNLSNRYHLTLGSVDTPPTGLQTPTPLVSTPPNTKEDTKDNKYIGEFEIFWKVYPNKSKKNYAYDKYLKVLKDYDSGKLLQMAKRFAHHMEEEKRETKFIQHCSAWLNQKTYLDYEDYKIENIKKKNLNAIAG